MTYLDKHLGQGEHVLYRARFPAITYATAWAALLVLGIVLIGIYIFVQIILGIWTTDLVVSNERVALKTGLLQVNVRQMEVRAVEDVTFTQSLMGRIFNYGIVTVHGSGEDRITTPAIADPAAFASAVSQAASQNTITSNKKIQAIPGA